MSAWGYRTTEDDVRVVTAAAKTWKRIHDSARGEEHYCSALYFTGGDVFNKNTRIHAVEMGSTVNVPVSHPLGTTDLACDVRAGDAGKALPVECEGIIFDYIH